MQGSLSNERKIRSELMHYPTLTSKRASNFRSCSKPHAIRTLDGATGKHPVAYAELGFLWHSALHEAPKDWLLPRGTSLR